MVVELRSTETFTVKWEESCSFKTNKKYKLYSQYNYCWQWLYVVNLIRNKVSRY